MRRISYKLTTIILMIIIIFNISGCGKKIYLTTGLSSNEILKINGSTCSKGEAMLLLTNEQCTYENAFGSDIWSKYFDGESLQSRIMYTVKTQLSTIKCMAEFAKEKNIKLTEAENTKVTDAASIYYTSLNDDEISYMGVDEATIISLYTNMALAQKVYNDMTAQYKFEVSDADAKVIKVKYIMKKYNDTNKEEILAKMNNIKELVSQGTDFNTLASQESDDESTECEVAKGSEVDENFANSAFKLSTNEVSEVIESKSAFYIIKCTNDYIEDRTVANKEIVANNMKAEKFREEYNPFMEKVTSEFNNNVWEKIVFEYKEDINTSNLFDVYQENVTQSN